MRLTFTGDILIEREQLKAVGAPYDFSSMLSSLSGLFAESDYIIGNLETPIAGEEVGYSCKLWSFNTPETILSALKSAGFSILTLANNHCLDCGVEGLIHTLHKVKQYGFTSVGAYADCEVPHYIILQCGDKKIALLASTYGTNSAFNGHVLNAEQSWMVDLLSPQAPQTSLIKYGRWYRYNIPMRALKKGVRLTKDYLATKRLRLKVEQTIKQAKNAGADFIIALPHFGGQYSPEPPVYSHKVVAWMFSHGVDLIIGNHEHVIERAVWLHKKFAAYCLGNFTCYPNSESALQSPNNLPVLFRQDVSVVVHLDFESGREYPHVRFVPIKNVVGSDGIVRVYTLYDLITAENDARVRNQYLSDNAWAVCRFVGRPGVKTVELKKEYDYE